MKAIKIYSIEISEQRLAEMRERHPDMLISACKGHPGVELLGMEPKDYARVGAALTALLEPPAVLKLPKKQFDDLTQGEWQVLVHSLTGWDGAELVEGDHEWCMPGVHHARNIRDKIYGQRPKVIVRYHSALVFGKLRGQGYMPVEVGRNIATYYEQPKEILDMLEAIEREAYGPGL